MAGFLDELEAGLPKPESSFLDELEQGQSVEISTPEPTGMSLLEEIEISAKQYQEQERQKRLARFQSYRDFSKEEHKGIKELKDLPSDLWKMVKEEVSQAAEHPFQTAAEKIFPLGVIKQSLADLALRAEDKKYWEAITGEKWLDDDEIIKLPPEKAREVKRRQSTQLSNLVADIKELAGLATLPVAAGEGIAKMPFRFKQAKERGASDLEAYWEATVGMRDTAASIAAKSVKSLAKTGMSPIEAFHDAPLETAANIAGAAGTALKITKGATAAERALRAARPTRVASDFLDELATAKPSLSGPIQLFLDKTAGTGEAGAVLQAHKAKARGTMLRRLDDITDTGIQKMDKKERAKLVRELGGERVKDAVPGIVNKRYQLSDDVEQLRKLLPASTLDEALKVPAHVDEYRRIFLKKNDNLAQQVDAARIYSDVDFIVDGVPMNSVEFITSRKRIDPDSIQVVVREGADPLLAERAKAVLLPIRRVLTEMSEEAANLDLGLSASPLIRRRTQSVHAGSYFPERRIKFTPDEDIAAYLDNVLPAVTGDELSQFKRANLKHKASQDFRTAAGALAPEEGHVALMDYVIKGTQGEMKMKMYADLARRFAVDDADVASLMRSVGVKSQSADSVVLKNGKRLHRVPDNLVEGFEVPRYGALSGKWIDEALWRNVRNTEKNIQKYWKRFVGNWKATKVGLNFPSHINQAFSNVLGNVVEGSSLADFGAAYKALKKRDELYRAARDAGILGADTVHGTDVIRLTPDLASDPVGFFGKVGAAIVNTHEKVMLKNRLSKRVLGYFQLSDSYSKLAHTNRIVKKKAKELGISYREALKRPEVMDEARALIESSWHPSYDEVPRVLEIADTYGVIPFARYSYRMIGNMIDAHVTHPFKMQAIHQGERARYDTASDRDQERMDKQATWYMDRGVPVDHLARLFGASGEQDFNTRYLNPVPLPDEILSMGRGGSWGSDLYNEALGTTYEDLIPKGFGGLVYELVNGKTLEFRSDLTEDQKLLWMDINGRLDHFINQMMPGAYYHLIKKLAPAMLDLPDYRGRELDPVVAGVHALGVRVEKSRVDDVERWITRGAEEARNDAYQMYSQDVERAQNKKQAQAAKKLYQKRLKEIEKMERRYLSKKLR